MVGTAVRADLIIGTAMRRVSHFVKNKCTPA
jgi:hypothetical protein